MLPRHLGIDSPVMSGEKVVFHEPIACGWMCSECKLVHRKHDLLRFSRCKRGTHTLVKANFVCNRCHEVADKVSDLESKPCPVSVVPSELPPHAEGSERQNEKIMLEARRDFTYTEEVKELRRLKLLKQLQEEREQLAKLLEQKNKLNRRFSAGFVYMCEHIQCYFFVSVYLRTTTYVTISSGQYGIEAKRSMTLCLWVTMSFPSWQLLRPFEFSYTCIKKECKPKQPDQTKLSKNIR